MSSDQSQPHPGLRIVKVCGSVGSLCASHGPRPNGLNARLVSDHAAGYCDEHNFPWANCTRRVVE